MTDQTTLSFRPGELELTGDDAGHLIGSACGSCGAHFFPSREVCARCLSAEMEQVPLSTKGELYTFTIIRQSTPDFEVPYVLGYVDLPEGVRVMGQVTGCDPAEVHIGMSLVLSIEPFGTDDRGVPVTGYRFRPDTEVNDE